MWHTSPVRLEAASEKEPCVILGVSLSDFISVGLIPEGCVCVIFFDGTKLIYNPSLSSSARPASVPCTDHAALEGSCGFLACWPSRRGIRWHESLACSDFIGLVDGTDQCWQEIEALLKSQTAVNLQETKLLWTYDFVVGLVVFSRSEEPDKNGWSMPGL